MRHFRSFFKKIFKFYFVPSRETVIFQSYRAWKAHFGCLESVFKAFHEYVLSIFRKPCASWALDIAPTLDVPVLFRQTTDLIVYVPLFTDFTHSRVLVNTVFTRFTVNPAVTGSSPCFSQKLFRAFFSALCGSIFFGAPRLFFDFFYLQRVPPSSFFWYFAAN